MISNKIPLQKKDIGKSEESRILNNSDKPIKSKCNG